MHLINELKCCFFLSLIRHIVKCHVNRARILIGLKSTTHVANRRQVKYEFTNTKKLVKKLARIETSSICPQHFANMFDQPRSQGLSSLERPWERG